MRGIRPRSNPSQRRHPPSVGGQPLRLQEAKGFQTLRNPNPSKSFTFTVANVATPWESIGRLPSWTGEVELGRSRLRGFLQFSIVESFPAKLARRGWSPFRVCLRFGRIDAQDVLDASPGELSHRDLPCFTDFPRARVDLVRKLDLSSCHDDRWSAQCGAVNVTASCCHAPESTKPGPVAPIGRFDGGIGTNDWVGRAFVP